MLWRIRIVNACVRVRIRKRGLLLRVEARLHCGSSGHVVVAGLGGTMVRNRGQSAGSRLSRHRAKVHLAVHGLAVRVVVRLRMMVGVRVVRERGQVRRGGARPVR